MSKIEDMIQETKLYEMLQKRDQEKVKKTLLWILAIVGAVAAIAGIAYAVYRFVTPKYLEEFEDDFDDDFEDEFFEDEEL
jgi:flagellar basal body-associated protein FliL